MAPALQRTLTPGTKEANKPAEVQGDRTGRIYGGMTAIWPPELLFMALATIDSALKVSSTITANPRLTALCAIWLTVPPAAYLVLGREQPKKGGAPAHGGRHAAAHHERKNQGDA